MDTIENVYVGYNPETMQVTGFFLEGQTQDSQSYIKIEKNRESELINLTNENLGTLFVVDVEKAEFESRVVYLDSTPEERYSFSRRESSEVETLKEEIAELKEMVAKLMEG